MAMIKTLLNSAVFWSVWVVIPVIAEILPAIGSMVILLRRRERIKHHKDTISFFPNISLIIPIYNSADTLEECLRSVVDSTYPTDRIHVFLANNETKDDSFSVFARCQVLFPQLNMQWLNAAQGKSRALNLALYNSDGKYIINIDSDGVLEPHALENLVRKFEAHPDINCMTGAILTTPEKIQAYPRWTSRLLRNLEFMEYAQAFLAGRSYAAELNTVYTLSGAFSAFRKSTILSSWLYSTDTVSEDTQLTFQMRYLHNERVDICEDAIFYTDPIESVNKLYTQRQRWQRGSLEVAQIFQKETLSPFHPFRDANSKALLYGHTFAFPRLMWYLVLLINYSRRSVFISTAIIMGLYILTGYFFFLSVLAFLRMPPDIREYYRDHWWVVALLPFFSVFTFFIQLAGTINSIGTDSSWRTKDLSQEREAFREVTRHDGKLFSAAVRGLRSLMNRPETQDGPTDSQAEAVTVLPISWYLCSGLLLFLSAALFFTVHWVSKTYGVSLDVLINTLTGNLQGTSTDVILAVIKGCVLPSVAAALVYILFVFFARRRDKRSSKRVYGPRKSGVLSRALPLLAATSLLLSVLYTNGKFDVLAYYQDHNTVSDLSASDIYRDHYVDPKETSITPVGKPKNLIYLYLESMETTYASAEDGGVQEVNCIPNLTRLAQENVSFSNSDKLGGFRTVKGAGYTMAALFTTTTGVPYALPVDTTTISETNSFASGITGLGDILKEKGYTNEFLCGSDAAFGGRKLYFTQHGSYEIFDLFSARDKGYVPPDYYVWWGYEDFHLFDIAKDEATRLYEAGDPFNLTFLTVDLHHISGYRCKHCGSDFAVNTANVASCTDRQVAEFVEWCKKQPFYQDTVIVITGDHPRMDTYLVDGVSYMDRTVYNCFINSAVDIAPEDTKNRELTHMDIFPTVLSAMGYQIKGNRLGLGVDLFSKEPTLSETIGYYTLDAQVTKSSSYYVDTFAPELSH